MVLIFCLNPPVNFSHVKWPRVTRGALSRYWLNILNARSIIYLYFFHRLHLTSQGIHEITRQTDGRQRSLWTPGSRPRSEHSCNGIRYKRVACWLRLSAFEVQKVCGGERGPQSKLHKISCTCSNLCFKWSCEISVLLAGHIWIICQGIAEICFWRRGDGIVCTRQGPRGAGKRTRRHMRALQLQSSFCDMRGKIRSSSWQTLFFYSFWIVCI